MARLLESRLVSVRELLHALQDRVDGLALFNAKNTRPVVKAERLSEEVKRLEKELQEHIAIMDELTAIRASQRAPRLSYSESELLTKINEGVPADLQRRYDELVAKRRDATITEAEHVELLGLTERVEEIDAKRVEYLAELARSRSTPLRALMKDLGIKTPAYA